MASGYRSQRTGFPSKRPRWTLLDQGIENLDPCNTLDAHGFCRHIRRRLAQLTGGKERKTYTHKHTHTHKSHPQTHLPKCTRTAALHRPSRRLYHVIARDAATAAAAPMPIAAAAAFVATPAPARVGGKRGTPRPPVVAQQRRSLLLYGRRHVPIAASCKLRDGGEAGTPLRPLVVSPTRCWCGLRAHKANEASGRVQEEHGGGGRFECKHCETPGHSRAANTRYRFQRSSRARSGSAAWTNNG